jgi:folate-binding protein YgfZ
MTTLRDFHQRQGARFGERAGRALVLAYGDSTREALAAAAGCGLIDRSARGKLRLTGADRVAFTQGMLTNDVKKLASGAGCYAAALTAKGKMISDCRVLVCADHLFIDMEPERAAAMLEFLASHVISEDVELADVSAELAILGVYGPRAAEALAAAFGTPVPSLAEHSHVKMDFGGSAVTVIGAGATGNAGFDLVLAFGQAGDLAERLADAGARFGLVPIGDEAFEILRVEAGIPRYGRDMDEETIPLEAGITERAISFEKGCYIGQEVIARATHRGHVNRKLVSLQFEGNMLPTPGTDLFATSDRDKPIGVVTSVVHSPARGATGLGYLRIEQLGAQLVTRDGTAVKLRN